MSQQEPPSFKRPSWKNIVVWKKRHRRTSGVTALAQQRPIHTNLRSRQVRATGSVKVTSSCQKQMHEEDARMDQVLIPITPVGKPRMTKRDKWMVRPCVKKYRNYSDVLKLHAIDFQKSSSLFLRFEMSMPNSWSKKKWRCTRNLISRNPTLTTWLKLFSIHCFTMIVMFFTSTLLKHGATKDPCFFLT